MHMIQFYVYMNLWNIGNDRKVTEKLRNYIQNTLGQKQWVYYFMEN